MKIAVLGGTGLTGRAAVMDLVASPDVSEVLIIGRNMRKAQQLAEKMKSSKVHIKYADVAEHESLVEAFRGADVVINATQYYFNLDVMNAALEAKVNYVDAGGMYWLCFKQQELKEQFKKAGLTAVISAGAEPGITNVMARYAVDKLDSVETIRARCGWVDFTKGTVAPSVTWSIITLMELYTRNAVVFENGVTKEIPPLSRKETVTFPEPVGTVDVYSTLHSEVALFPLSFKDKGIKNVDWMEGGPGMLEKKLLADIGLGSTEPIKVKGLDIIPRDFLYELMASRGLLGFSEDVIPDDWEVAEVEVIGKEGQKRVTYIVDTIIPPHKQWKLSAGQTGTGFTESIVAQMILRGDIEQRGVMPPELCVKPELFFRELAKRGFKTYVTCKELIS